MTRYAAGRPHPIGRVVGAAAKGGGILGIIVLTATGLLYLADWVELPGVLVAVAATVSTFGGAVLLARAEQPKVETVTTPLSDPRDIDGRPLVPEPPSEPPAMDPPAYGRRRTFGDPGD